MSRINLSNEQVQGFARALRGGTQHPSHRYQEVLAEAGILPLDASLALLNQRSLDRLDAALVPCASCDTYQPAVTMTHSGQHGFCPECITFLTLGQAAGG